MRLSEAIRLGAMMDPQAFGWFEDGRGTCAMGAAARAVGPSANLAVLWPVMRYGPATCPACGLTFHSTVITHATSAMVVHLNDIHRWTRERIADWVETVERAHEECSVSALSAAVEAVTSPSTR